MKVVMVSPNFHPYVGGAERQALELSKALHSQGIDVSVLTRSRPGLPKSQTLDGVRIYRLFAPGGYPSIGFMAAVFGWLWSHSSEWDVVHAHLAGSHALPAALMAKLLRRPAFVKIGGGRGIGEVAVSTRSVRGRLKWRTLRWLRPRLVAVTADLADELAEHDVDLPVSIIPNGVDTERFKPAPQEIKESLRQQSLDWPRGLSFIYAGRLAPEKRLGDFIGAFAEALKRTSVSAHFILAGEGPEEPGLRETAEKAGLLEKGVHFRGAVDELEQKIYPMADVFVLPSESEGLSNALLEAMSCGLAVIASRVGGTVQVVEDGQSGILFKSGDREEMTRSIERLLRRPEDVHRMGVRAREIILAGYDLRRVASRYRELYGDKI